MLLVKVAGDAHGGSFVTGYPDLLGFVCRIAPRGQQDSNPASGYMLREWSAKVHHHMPPHAITFHHMPGESAVDVPGGQSE